jgi:hypothetical protein
MKKKNTKTKSRKTKKSRKIKKTKKTRKTKTSKTSKTSKKYMNMIDDDITNKEFKRLHKKGEMIKLQCSPKLKKKEFSCYEDETLYKLRDLWNARHPDNEIITNDTKEIWLSLKKNMEKVCNKESCWLKQKFVDGKLDKEFKESFAPKSPKEWKKKPNTWLSSLEILEVMKQYEKTYKCFEFIGPSPIDFDLKKMYGECVWDELCNFSVAEQIKNGKTKIGIIFNTDPHNKGGEHWISLFINIKKRKIFYFDSAGGEIKPEIKNLVDRIIKEGSQMNIPINFIFDQNYPVEHQYGNTECGVYSIYFIVHMLEDKITGEYLKSHIINDKYMEKFRKIYFNEEL